jgi:hypothetical protein
MTNHDHIKRLLLQIGEQLETLKDKANTHAEKNDIQKVWSSADDAIEELAILDGDKLAEAYDVKALYDRIHLCVVYLRCLRVTLEALESAADNALSDARLITHALEDSQGDDDTL